MNRAIPLLCAAFSVGALASAVPAVAADAECKYPADVLDLKNWKETLPTGSSGKPKEVKQPELATFSADPWFVPLPGCNGVRFRAAVNGVTTSGSSYPRSELREMTNNGKDNAAWSSNSGKHTLEVEAAVTHLPNDKPHVVAAQIHGGDDDVSVFRIEGNKVYITNGDNSKYHLVTSDYQLGKKFTARFEVSGGKIKAYFDGKLQTTLSKSFSGAYFKTGAYTQANCSKSSPCSSSNYGEVHVFRVNVTHG
ncbi:polysaccharide lyase family 7 protein [Allokutzneria sp. A3M-2-11 16]|uniref:polysaccharide lyase family 7 protein n=1 Tax=Allokutzneria sp. A3M-2-11 16 TaxID=2962043 RepID=UPI0020B74B50|nr:polysaccharide lyase family 7 protein [Allokutzneria sp. A3M-2-11 16]MCP3801183.1 polysaccharide lyase family 7 protein [Allokutzneria sp. A3M-2-11 16]